MYSDNGKCCNLVLVVIWRSHLNGNLHRKRLHNVCTDPDSQSTGVYYVHDVFDYHLNPVHQVAFLRRFKTLYIVGDHGPHFIGKETFYNESRFLAKYGVKVHVLFLCSYHAYSEADGAGVAPKQLMKASQAANMAPQNAVQLANLINKDGHFYGWQKQAYAFPSINMSAYVFGDVTFLETRTDGHKLGKLCEVMYLPEVEGAMLGRKVPGEGPWALIDLIVRPTNDKLCGWCTPTYLKAVKHQGQPCPLMKRGSTGEVHEDIGRLPDPNRIVGYL